MSTERDLLRDYAREAYTVNLNTILNTTVVDDRMAVGQRGEIAGKTFVALQNVLDILETCDGMELTRVGIEGLRDAIRKGLT